MVKCPKCNVHTLQSNQHGKGIQCSNCGYTPVEWEENMDNEQTELKELLETLEKSKIDFESFLDGQRKLDSKNVQMLRVQFYQVLAESDMDNETAQAARKRFEKILGEK